MPMPQVRLPMQAVARAQVRPQSRRARRVPFACFGTRGMRRAYGERPEGLKRNRVCVCVCAKACAHWRFGAFGSRPLKGAQLRCPLPAPLPRARGSMEAMALLTMSSNGISRRCNPKQMTMAPLGLPESSAAVAAGVVCPWGISVGSTGAHGTRAAQSTPRASTDMWDHPCIFNLPIGNPC